MKVFPKPLVQLVQLVQSRTTCTSCTTSFLDFGTVRAPVPQGRPPPPFGEHRWTHPQVDEVDQVDQVYQAFEKRVGRTS